MGLSQPSSSILQVTTSKTTTRTHLLFGLMAILLCMLIFLRPELVTADSGLPFLGSIVLIFVVFVSLAKATWWTVIIDLATGKVRASENGFLNKTDETKYDIAQINKIRCRVLTIDRRVFILFVDRTHRESTFYLEFHLKGGKVESYANIVDNIREAQKIADFIGVPFEHAEETKREEHGLGL